MQHESCRHVKADGAYCGSPSLRDQKYCYYHLTQRGRRLRRARALRDNLPYRLDIQSLDNPYAIRAALTEIAQALAAGQLEARVAGKLLYAIQQVSAVNRRIEQMEAAQLKEEQEAEDQASTACSQRSPRDASRIQEYPGFDKEFELPPGADLDAETEAVLRKADQQAELRHAESMPQPPPGVRPGSVAHRVYREEAYQMLRLEVNQLRRDLRDYHAQQREPLKKEVMAAFPAPERRADTA